MIAILITIVFVLAGAALLLFGIKEFFEDARLKKWASAVVYVVAGIWLLYTLYSMAMGLPFVHGSSGHVRL